MTVALTKFNQFVADLGNGSHRFQTDTFKMALTNTNPTAGIISNLYTFSNISEITSGNGYTTGGNTCAFVGWGQGGGIATLYLANPATWTASGGSIPTFRYCVVYNDTQTSPAKPMMGYYDIGTGVTLSAGQTFNVVFDATNGVITVT